MQPLACFCDEQKCKYRPWHPLTLLIWWHGYFPHLVLFTGRTLFLMPKQQCQITEDDKVLNIALMCRACEVCGSTQLLNHWLLNTFFIILKQCLQTIPLVVQTNENHLQLSLDCIVDVVTITSPIYSIFCTVWQVLCGKNHCHAKEWHLSAANLVVFLQIAGCNWPDSTEFHASWMHTQPKASTRNDVITKVWYLLNQRQNCSIHQNRTDVSIKPRTYYHQTRLHDTRNHV